MFAKTSALTAGALAIAASIAFAQPAQPPEGFFADTPAEFRPFVETCKPWDDWDKPAPPFNIHGNSYYVGTCGIASILITGENGHVLIDSGTEAGAEIVLANIAALGLVPEDVDLLLSSHEHFDHVGGMARLQAATGALVVSSRIGTKVMRTGVLHPDDPQYGMHDPMQPVEAILPLDYNRPSYLLETFGFSPIETPGHTPGALSWQWESCEGDQCFSIVYADSLSPVSSDDYKFNEHPEYLAVYHAGLERLAHLDCDILLTPHPSHSRMLRRMRVDAMVEPEACANYAIGKANDIERRLENERSVGRGE